MEAEAVRSCPRGGQCERPGQCNAVNDCLGRKLPNKVPMPVSLPTSAQARKAIPLVRGLLDYFPAALAAVAEVSKAGNDQHNPGEEMHWARGKSSDHADCIVRHLVDRGTVDTDGGRHSAKVAWRALALLQEELEAEGAPAGRGSRFPAESCDTFQIKLELESL